MKVCKFYNISLVIFFVVAISLPLVFVNKMTGRISATENRALANFPSFNISKDKFNRDFIKEFEKWFNDNLGFRDNLVKANTLLQFKLFGKLTKTDTIIGKDNWLYYVTPDIIKDYQQLNLPSEKQLALWGNSLEGINGYLKGKNIPFIMMLCLDKKTIYPENYPDTIFKVGNVSKTDLFINYITNNTSIDFFTPKDALFAAKAHATVYSSRVDNAHWNRYGAFIGYLELMDRVKKYYPNIKVLSWDDFEISSYQRETKVYDAIGFSEVDYSFKLRNKPTAVETHGYLAELDLRDDSHCYTYTNNNKKLPKALIFGDSYLYFNYLVLPIIAESFSEVTFIHTSNIDRIDSLVSRFNPDIVIYENAERMLDYIMPILPKLDGTLADYSVYQNLPIITDNFAKDKPLMWIDYCNNSSVQLQGKIIIEKSSEVVNLVGWALDQKSLSTASDVFIKVGNKYYAGKYGIPRASVADHFKDPNLKNSGFTFDIDTRDMINEGKISFVIISKDKSYQYAPIEFTVEVK